MEVAAEKYGGGNWGTCAAHAGNFSAAASCPPPSRSGSRKGSNSVPCAMMIKICSLSFPREKDEVFRVSKAKQEGEIMFLNLREILHQNGRIVHEKVLDAPPGAHLY